MSVRCVVAPGESAWAVLGAAALVAGVRGGESRAGKKGNNHCTNVLSFTLWSSLKGEHQSHRNPKPAIKGEGKVTMKTPLNECKTKPAFVECK